MERDYVIPPDTKIKQKGIFALDELYILLYQWFKRYGYTTFREVEYLEKRMPNGKEISIKWYGNRKINEYIRYVIEINFLVLGFQEIEVEKDNKRYKSGKGDIEMRFRSYLEIDYENMWGQSAMTRFFRAIYDKYILGSKIEQYEDELYEETYKLMDQARSFLNLHKFV